MQSNDLLNITPKRSVCVLKEDTEISPALQKKIDRTINHLSVTGYVDVCVRRLQDYGLSDKQIIEILTPYSTQIVDKILSQKHKELPPYCVYEMILLLGTGARWPELIAAINEHKHAVIKYFLQSFKEHSADDIELEVLNTDIEKLQQIGINWPELAIVKRSIETDLERRTTPGSINEAQPVIPPKIVKSFNTHLNRIYESGISRLAYMIIEMKNLGATDQQIASLLSEKRQEIVRILRNTIHNESPKNWRPINEFATAIASLIDLGIKWPPLLELLNYYQDKIEAWAVAAITDAGFGKHVAEVLRKFKQLGYDITPIRRAIKTGILPTLKEYITKNGFDHYTYAKLQALHKLNLLPKSLDAATTKLIINAIDKTISEKGIPNDFGNSLKYLAAMNIPNLESTVKDIIEANKTPVIKTLLTAMKTGLGNANNYYSLPTYYIVDTLQILHKLGIRWPEMAAITRSLKAER